MTIIHDISLDWSNRPLSHKKRDAIKKLKQGIGYSAYVLRMNGEVIRYDVSSTAKRGYTQRTLKNNQFKIIWSK